MATEHTPNARAEIQALLASEQNNYQLLLNLQTVAEREGHDAFSALADVWAVALYERDPHYFESFLLEHLHRAAPSVITDIQRLAERDQNEELFRALYRLLITAERWNAELIALAESDLSDEALLQAIRMRTFYQPLREAAALALYRRNVQAIEQWLLNYSYWETRGQNYAELRKAILERQGQTALYEKLFRMGATPEEWHAKVQSLIDNVKHPEWIGSVLTRWQPANAGELPEDLVQSLLKRFGDQAGQYLERNLVWLARRRVHEVLAQPMDNDQLEKAMWDLYARLQWQMLTKTSDIWAPFLYDRSPERFASFISGYSDQSNMGVFLDLIQRAKADGHIALARNLYMRVANEADWNKAVLAVAQSDLDNDEVARELEFIDVREVQRWSNIHLNDAAACALYARDPARFFGFVWRYLSEVRGAYPQLLRLVEAHAAPEDYQRVFRQVASASDWERQMERLLTEAVPADRIVAELDKWHPVAGMNARPTILRRFLDQYGEVMLPYLERTINWATPARLQSLLALKIERGELLRELQAIASRQPIEFTAQAAIWAPRLYELGQDFFAGFLRRYLGRGQEYVVRELLPRIERDGHDKLYRDLYEVVTVNEGEWQRDIARAIQSAADNDDLLRRLNMRDVRWFSLPEQTALDLYRRNRPPIRQFVLNHLRSRRRWWSDGLVDFNRLRAEAEKRGDTELVEVIDRSTGSTAAQWTREAQRLLASDLPADQIASAFERIHPRSEWEVRDRAPVLEALKRYGDAMMPYVIGHLGWLRQSDNVMSLIKVRCSESWYWRAILEMGALNEWNEALEALLSKPLSDDAFFARLAMLTPDAITNRWQRWMMRPEMAAALYRRSAARARPFLELTLDTVDMELYRLADTANDDEFLDFLTYRLMWQMQQRGHQRGRVEPKTEPDPLVQMAIARFDRLYAESPTRYLRHAANILSRVRAFAISRWSDLTSSNVIYTYLTTQHREAWLRSPEAMRDLLESPSIYIQLAAFDMLASGGADAADRVVENLPSLRAILLGRGRRETKRRVLRALELAVQAAPHHAERIAAVLDDVADFRSRRAITEDLVVTLGRLQRLAHEEV